MKKRNLEECPRDTNYKRLRQLSCHNTVETAILRELEFLKKENEDLKKRLDRQFKRQNRFCFYNLAARTSKLIMDEYDDNMFDENADFFSIKNKVSEIWEKIKEEKKKKEEKERREKKEKELKIYNEIRPLFEACDNGKVDEVKNFCENSNISKKDLITKEYIIRERLPQSGILLMNGNKINAISIINDHFDYQVYNERARCEELGERCKNLSEFGNNIVLIAKYFSTILYPNPTVLEKKYLYKENYMIGDLYANPICSPFFSAIIAANDTKNVDDIKLFIKEKGIGIINECGYFQTDQMDYDYVELKWTNAISYVNTILSKSYIKNEIKKLEKEYGNLDKTIN